MSGLVIRNFTDAQGGVFYNAGVPYDSTGALLVAGAGTIRGAEANTNTLLGDSIAANNWATSSDNYKVVNPHGALEMANVLLGQRFNVIQNLGVNSSTAVDCLDDQIPLLAATPTKYAWISTGTNDLYADAVSGSVVYSRVIAVVEACLDLGVIPIWATVRARAASAIIDEHLWCNDLLRQYASRYNCGIFYDAYMLYQDHTATDGSGKATFYYDDKIHPNNLGSYWEGKLIAEACKAAGVPKAFIYAYGAEDQTNSTGNSSNLLANPNFTGTGGTVSTNCTGTMPTSWTVDWATRTGTGSAAASIVDWTDPDTGLVVGKGVQIVLSGSPANADVLRITQTTANGWGSNLVGGNDMSAECVLKMTSPVNFRQIGMRTQANIGGTDESTWFGVLPSTSGGGSVQDVPEAGTWYLKTRKLAVKGSGSAGSCRFDLRITFSGAATGTFVMALPRVRKS